MCAAACAANKQDLPEEPEQQEEIIQTQQQSQPSEPEEDEDEPEPESQTYPATPSQSTTANRPAAPTGLQVGRLSETTSAVSWNAVSGAASYEAQFRSPSTNNVWTRDTEYSSGTAYTITQLVNARVYGFRVRAVNADGTSEWLEISYTHHHAGTNTENPPEPDQNNAWDEAPEEESPSAFNPEVGKPVIYLYPQRTQDVSVKLDFDGTFTYTYPTYRNGWNVTASPSGRMINKADNSTHYYLFWEGNTYFNDWDFSEGFVVKGDEVERFLLERLPLLGLTPREYNDFITYWAPKMIGNKYNLVTFATAQYEELAKLTVSPAPDTMIIVHMVWKPIPVPVAVREQTLPRAPRRSGFTLVEWGGTRAG